MPKVAIAILNFNGIHFLEKFLPPLIKYSALHQIYVIDNGSTDESISFLKQQFPSVKAIELPENLGFAGGYNKGLSFIESEYFLLLNSDVEVSENWIEPLLNFLENNHEFSACQPKVLSYHNKSYFEYAGACGGFIDSMGYPYCRGRVFNNLEKDFGQYNNIKEIFWTSGACMLIRSEDFFKVDMFDEDFFAHMEEIDLCWKLHRINKKVACVPQSTVFHVGGGSLSKSSPKKTYLNFKNGMSLLLKNLPANQLYKIPIRMCLDFFAALLFWKQSNYKHFEAIIKGHFDFLINMKQDWNKRNKLSFKKIEPQLMITKSIVFNNYILRKHKFHEIDKLKKS